MIYIHYGTDEYKDDLFTPVTNVPIDNILESQKPRGGLWGSRKNDDMGWADWCRNEGYRINHLEHSFLFVMNDGARIRSVNTLEDITTLSLRMAWKPKDLSWADQLAPGEMPTMEQLEELYRPNPCFIDFEELSKCYDAIEITNYPVVRQAFPLWDCNSILVLNPETVHAQPLFDRLILKAKSGDQHALDTLMTVFEPTLAALSVMGEKYNKDFHKDARERCLETVMNFEVPVNYAFRDE